MEKNAEGKISDIEKKIDELRSNLPTLLNIASQETKAKDSFSPPTAAAWIVDKHETEKGLVLKVAGGGGYSSGKKPEEINFKQKLYISVQDKGGMDVVDSSGNILGRVLNFSPLTYSQFQSAMELCYNLNMLPVDFLDIVHKYNKDEKDYVHYTVQIKEKPIFKNPFRTKRILPKTAT